MTTRLLPNALHFSEFQGGYHGTCGETALATAMVCSSAPIESTQDAINLLLSMTREMIGLGWASASGSTPTQRLHDEAIRRGFTPDAGSFISYSEPLDPAVLHPLLLSTAGIKPIILEIARAGLLPGDEVGVQYHFICIVGITDAGYICNDGDNSQISQHLVTYSWQQIEAAVPCGVLVLEMQQGANTMAGVPSGWTDDGSALHNPVNGFIVKGQIRYQLMQDGHDPLDVPLDNEVSVDQVEEANQGYGPGVVQYFKFSQYSAIPDPANPGQWKAWRTWVGSEAAFLRSQAQTLRQQVKAQADEIAALKQQPAPPPVPAPIPLDPSVKAALSQAISQLQPQVALSSLLSAVLSKLP